jgi:co-chaperonin GroES (HSP10)
MMMMIITTTGAFGGSLYSINKNTESSIVASKWIGLEINADKTKYMIMSSTECRMTSQYEGR